MAVPVPVTVSPLPPSTNPAAGVEQGGPGCGEQPVSHWENTETLSEGTGEQNFIPGSAAESFPGAVILFVRFGLGCLFCSS